MKFISVTPLQKEDKEKAKVMEKILNYKWDKLVENPEFRISLAEKSLFGGNFSEEEIEGYFNKVI